MPEIVSHWLSRIVAKKATGATTKVQRNSGTHGNPSSSGGACVGQGQLYFIVRYSPPSSGDRPPLATMPRPVFRVSGSVT